MSDTLSHRALSAVRRSDRKAAQLLGVTITRDPLALIPHGIHMRPKRFPVRFGSGNKLVPGSLSPDDRQPNSVPVSACHPHTFAWDVPDPFASSPSDLTQDVLVQDQIARARRYESIGPLQPCDDDNDTYDEDEDEESYDSSDGDYDDDADAEDEDSESESDSSDDPQDVDKPNVIALPRLLHTVPLRFIGPFSHSPPPSPVSRSPTPLFYPSDDESELDLDDLCGEDSTQWADLAQTYNDLAEAEERDARKAKRDAHRSRLKALAILGPEASVAL